MKQIFAFVLPVLLVLMIVLSIFGIIHTKNTQERLTDELSRKAKNVSESLEISAKGILENSDKKTAARITAQFETREMLQGCILINNGSEVLASSRWLSDFKLETLQELNNVISSRTPAGFTHKNENHSLYIYGYPIENESGAYLGSIILAYDTSYIDNILIKLWKNLSITLVILIIATSLLILILHRQIFIQPLRKATLWFERFQKGETDENLSMKDDGDIGRFAKEVEQVALDLRVARKTASEQASTRIIKQDIWTVQKLKDLVTAKLGQDSLFVVSNREPYMHVTDSSTDKAKCVRPASGVVTALDPILRACGGLWIAQGSGNADKKFVNSKNKLGVPPEDINYILKRVWLNKQEEDGYYYGFSNECLWPLCHISYTRPMFREKDWQTYKEVNQKFADQLLEELPVGKPYIFIQDYHFTLLPKMIRDKRPDAVIALFWHIPWPNPEVFSICPYKKEILDGMLGCDLIGFHVQYHCNNFLDTANRFLESRVDAEKFSIIKDNHETFVKPFPISIDPYIPKKDLLAYNSIKESLLTEMDLKGKIIGLSVERADYTKGIVEHLQAVDRFLDKHPQYKNKFVFIQLAAPSRTHIKKYHDLMAEIEETVERINWKHADGSWKPIIYKEQHFSIEEIKPYYLMADLCIVSSLHDGMNLVAKEYISCRTDLPSTLILSQFTGAARELKEAVFVNPYATDEFADSIKYALELPDEEKLQRAENMRKTISENNVYAWAANIINELTAIKKS